MIKLPKETKEKLKNEIKAEVKAEILEQLLTHKARLDQSDVDSIIAKVQSQIIQPKIDSKEIIESLLSQVKTDDEQKRIDFYRQEVFTDEIKKEIGKVVLDQIELPKNGEQGPKGDKGEGYTLTEQDKREISNLVDLSSVDNNIKRAFAQYTEQLKTGKIRIPRGAGIDVKELLAEINKAGPIFGYLDLEEDTELTIPSNPGVISWNKKELTANLDTGVGPVLQIGQEIYFLFYNDTGSDIANLTPLRPKAAFELNGVMYPTVELAYNTTHLGSEGTLTVATMDVPDGTIGLSTRFGRVRNCDTSAWTPGTGLFLGSTPGTLEETYPPFPDYAISMGGVIVQDETEGEFFVSITRTFTDTVVNFWNGVFRESFNFFVTSNGTTVTGSLSPSNGHPDMTMMFSDGLQMLTTTPAATIQLTPGTDSSPQQNFIYIPKTTKVLTVSTTTWPTVEHIKIATVVLRSAAKTQTDGALKNHNWNDEVQSTLTNQGHLSHLGERIRQLDAKWDSGVSASISGTPTNVYVSTTSGFVYQMHKQTFPAQAMPTSDIHVVNHPSTPYVTVTNLNTQTVDASNVTLVNRSFSFVVWGVQNKTGEMSHLMVNLPLGSYSRLLPLDAVNDANNYAVYSIPKIFQGTGFLIARFTFQLDAGGTQWTLYNTEDLRGFVPNSTAGSGGGGGGVTEWTGLNDTPATLTAYGMPRVNSAGNAFDFTTLLKSGATQAAAGAVAGEFWRTSGHATLPDNVILQGV